MRIPVYQGGSIVNLMASLLRARGGDSAYRSLRLLPPEAIAGHTNLVLLVIDGLGADWLARRSPAGILSRHLAGRIDSVFPPTTAAAITTFLTGEAPQQHGLTGWHMWLRELGCVVTVLPGRPRYGGQSYRAAGIDPVRLFGHVPLSQRIVTRAVTVSPAQIARSDFNQAHLGRAELRTFTTLHGMFRTTLQAIRQDRAPKYLYLYWPRLDSIGHEQGMESGSAVAHLKQIEQALTDFLVATAGTDTLVLATADHGQVDTKPADRIDLAEHPELADCLAIPLCGEPRAAFCYLRAGRSDDFLAYCREVLRERIAVHSSRELLDLGLFGPGTPHPRLTERIGDYLLLGRGSTVIRDRLPFEEHHTQIGVHGGLTAAELEVPLCLLRT
jgi:hypothetical protein